MGSTQTFGMAAAIADGDVALEAACSAQVTGNFYPPLPAAYGPLLAEAVRNVADGDPSAPVALPADLDPLPRLAYDGEDGPEVSSETLVDICRAWPFVYALTGYGDDLDD